MPMRLIATSAETHLIFITFSMFLAVVSSRHAAVLRCRAFPDTRDRLAPGQRAVGVTNVAGFRWTR